MKMKPRTLFTTLAVLGMTALGACRDGAPREFTTRIRGEVIDRPQSKTLLLNRIYEDNRVVTTPIEIVDGKFSYDLRTDTREMYMLVFEDEKEQGAWRPVYFFAEPGKVELRLYPTDRYDENRIDGPKLNAEYAALQDSIDVWRQALREGSKPLFERGYRPKQMTMSVVDGLTVQHPDTSTAQGRAMHEQYLALQERTLPGRQLDYYRRHPSEVSYALLYRSITSELQWSEESAQPYIDIYNEEGYAEKYPDSPYTRQLANRLGALGNLRVGGRYIDFSLPDLDGNLITLSECIDGQVALIDLWMTWCGPCRRNAMAAIPVYEEFKERGFTVVGVGGGNDLDAIRGVVRQDGYPWITLAEVKNTAEIWSLYGIANAGGGSWLVDRDGTILAVNPTADQLREILAAKLDRDE